MTPRVPVRMTQVLTALALAIALATSGCGRKGATSGLDAAIVPGADIVAKVDMEGIRSSAIVQATKNSDSQSNAVASDIFWKPFWTATGLTRDDVAGVVVSVDLENLDLANTPPDSQLNKLEAIMAFELKKSLTMDQLKAGIAAMDVTHQATVTPVTIEGETAFKTEEGGVVSVQGDGRYVFFAPNEGCLGEALIRLKKGKAEKLSPAMSTAFKSLSDAPQVRVALVLTEALQAKMKESLEAQRQKASSDLGSGMMIGMLGPMVNTESLGLSVTFTSNVALNLGCVFTTVEAATQMKGTVDMLLGMLAMAAQQKAPNQAGALAHAITSTQSESRLTLSITLKETDLALIKSLQNTTGVKP